MLSNVVDALLRAWHPVALATEVGDDPYRAVLADREWALRRGAAGVIADPAPFGVTQRWGLLWLAAREPLIDLSTDGRGG